MKKDGCITEIIRSNLDIMKTKKVFVCTECGNEFPKWMGRCTACGAWNSVVEETKTIMPKSSSSSSYATATGSLAKPKRLSELSSNDEERIKTGIEEFDRVLGGGIVPGSLILLGGDPGIGKSTILLQMCECLGKSSEILYVSGEESQRQIKLRADRLGVTTDKLKVFSSTNMADILECLSREKPDVLIVDSVQTVYNPNIDSAPGSVSQIRDITVTLMRIAKESSIPIFLVGHVTKEGSIAGPKILEHMVDCVLYFEGEQHRSYRIIRSVKNRFGSTNEIGVFEMTGSGLQEIKNPSMAMLSGRPKNTPGSCIVCAMEGSRPMLAEIQALATPTVFGNPRRMTSGLDLSRTIMLLAVLEKRAGLRISTYDTYVNAVGGIKITEPALDVGIILAIASAYRNSAIDEGIVAIGEVGLTGELRSCNFVENRIREAEKLGFTKCIIPASNSKNLSKFNNIEVCPYFNILQILNDVL